MYITHTHTHTHAHTHTHTRTHAHIYPHTRPPTHPPPTHRVIVCTCTGVRWGACTSGGACSTTISTHTSSPLRFSEFWSVTMLPS